MLHYETVSPSLLKVLKILKILRGTIIKERLKKYENRHYPRRQSAIRQSSGFDAQTMRLHSRQFPR